ncbi:Serine/threonine protein kinase [Nannocystis exedens]|uniref:Serine/threonine protein kinase n=1 Tax=Nannocystis exedens TaxID=54 RepID=A0A1I2GLE5_9BACT|nr:serine/threonine-protein kinase [Nannocystis exedens]PCC73627.1 serine/threonine protein kinase [Nannocystis exedens]SFF18043.1 Serine/threonine protein kinase [Nannocystis exedens]
MMRNSKRRTEHDTASGSTVYDSGGDWPSVEGTFPGGSYGGGTDPLRIGRFHIHGRLGEGGMGVVYSGFDGELGRSVAIKLMHAALDTDLEARPRLLREAQALARLSHPNVVQIFEVGHHEGRLFVAMEYVDGKTLQAWLRRPEGPRTWRQILDVFIAAGRGLAAAHEVGLVHRDFKPSNVMIGSDGRVRVLDFGLVGSLADDVPSPSASQSLRVVPHAPVLQTPLTMTGDILGTPAYMAPEQYNGRRCDARADQFSFCVALYEALYGLRPFAGNSAWDALEASERGEISPPPPDSRVPAWLHAAVVRGLSPDPAARWPSMKALLAELDRDRDGPARARTTIAVAAATLGLGVWLSALRGPAPAERCAAEVAADLADVWDEQTPAELAPPVHTQVLALVEKWKEARRDLCLGRLGGMLSDEMLYRGSRCLAAHRQFLQRLARELDYGATDLDWRQLPSPAKFAACVRSFDRAETAMNAIVMDPEALRRIEDQLAEAEVAWLAGRYRDSEALATAAVRDARELGHPPTLAHALYHLSRAQDAGPRAALSGATLAEADHLAVAHDLPDLAADVALRRLRFAVYQSKHPRDGWVWYDVLRGRLARVGSEGDPREVEAHDYLGLIALAEGDVTLAEDEFLKARDGREGAWPLLRTPALMGLGRTFLLRGDPAAAHEVYAEARSIIEVELGPDHPKLVPALLNHIDALLPLERYDEAEAAARRALELADVELASPHLSLAQFYAAVVAEQRGELERALALAESARAALRAEGLTADQRGYRPYVLDLVARLSHETGGAKAAIAPYHELLTAPEGRDPAYGPRLAQAYTHAATLAEEAGVDELALRFAAAARSFLSDVEPAKAPALLVELALAEGAVLARRGHTAAATLVIRSALDSWDPGGQSSDARAADLHYALFSALRGPAPADALPHALRARDAYAALAAPPQAKLATLAEWLRARPNRSGDRR